MEGDADQRAKMDHTYDGQQPIAVSPSFSMLHIELYAAAIVFVVARLERPPPRSTVHRGKYPEGQASPGE